MSNNYVLGRGKLHFGQFRRGTQVARGERYLGNTPELGFSAEQENLDHYNSDEGVRVKDESVVLQLDYMGSFITDNISPENLAMFFLGEHASLTVTAATEQTNTFSDIEPGLTYQLGATLASPSGARMVANVSVAGAAEGVDYTVDNELGRITVLDDSSVLSAGTELTVTFDIEAHTRNRVISKADTIEGELRFIAINATGANVDYFMPWVKITPNGDYALKGDEWQQLGFNIEILKKAGREAIYMDDRPYIPS